MSADEVGASFKSGDYLGRVHKDGNALAAEAFEGMTLYTDHREMLAAENLDIVTVGVSDHRHADIVVNAANTPGVKGIFCPPNPHHPHPRGPFTTTLETSLRARLQARSRSRRRWRTPTGCSRRARLTA